MAEDLINGVIPCDVLNLADGKALAGLLLVLGGLSLRSWAAGFLIKNDQLTTTGPYALIRNPLYLGSFLMVAGYCLLLNDRENIWVLSIALAFIYGPKVRSEERWLSQRFPSEWAQYAARTWRFLPRTLALPQIAGWRLSQWLKSREYNAVLASAAALVALAALRTWQRVTRWVRELLVVTGVVCRRNARAGGPCGAIRQASFSKTVTFPAAGG